MRPFTRKCRAGTCPIDRTCARYKDLPKAARRYLKRICHVDRREAVHRQRWTPKRNQTIQLVSVEHFAPLLRGRRPYVYEAAPDASVPRHVAIILDGNGRWAKQRGLARIFGHEEGAKAVRQSVEGCGEAGVEYLTLYAFSQENWQRPKLEVTALMHLLQQISQGNHARN